MKKLAIFVEGQTEQIFIKELIGEFATKTKIQFEVQKYSVNRIVKLTSSSITGKEFLVLIYNCENDEKVKTKVLEERSGLVSKGFQLILGLRDLYPNNLSELQLIKSRLAYKVPSVAPITEILLAVSEVEAWFLQESTHYSRLDPSLDITTFSALYGFDPFVDSAELIHHPTNLLRTIYGSVGIDYNKKKAVIDEIVSAIDFAELCFTASGKLPHFQPLLAHLDYFFDESRESEAINV